MGLAFISSNRNLLPHLSHTTILLPFVLCCIINKFYVSNRGVNSQYDDNY